STEVMIAQRAARPFGELDEIGKSKKSPGAERDQQRLDLARRQPSVRSERFGEQLEFLPMWRVGLTMWRAGPAMWRAEPAMWRAGLIRLRARRRFHQHRRAPGLVGLFGRRLSGKII